MTASRILLLLLASLLTPSCATWFFDPADTSTADYVALHRDPRPGDWALRHLSQSSGLTKLLWTVLEVDERGVLVRREFVDNPHSTMAVEYLLALDGTVLEATLIYEGERYAQRVIPRGEPGGYENFLVLDTLPSEPAEVPAGRFDIDGVETYDYTLDVIFMTYAATTIDYLSRGIPFAVVERRRIFDGDAGLWLTALSTTTYAASAVNANRYDRLLDIADHTGDAEGIDYERLAEFGFGEAGAD